MSYYQTNTVVVISIVFVKNAIHTRILFRFTSAFTVCKAKCGQIPFILELHRLRSFHCLASPSKLQESSLLLQDRPPTRTYARKKYTNTVDVTTVSYFTKNYVLR